MLAAAKTLASVLPIIDTVVDKIDPQHEITILQKVVDDMSVIVEEGPSENVL